MRATADGIIFTERGLEGYVIKYGSLSVPRVMPNGRRVFERFAPGACSEGMADVLSGARKIKANVEHEQDNALLQLGESGQNIDVEHRPDGVFIRARMINDSVGNDLWTKVKAGAVKGLSIECDYPEGYTPRVEPVGGDYLKTIERAILKGFAVTCRPVYPDSVVNATILRSFDKMEMEQIAGEVAGLERRRLLEHEAFLYGVR
jgi:HK97 family phage prohead protease